MIVLYGTQKDNSFGLKYCSITIFGFTIYIRLTIEPTFGAKIFLSEWKLVLLELNVIFLGLGDIRQRSRSMWVTESLTEH